MRAEAFNTKVRHLCIIGGSWFGLCILPDLRLSGSPSNQGVGGRTQTCDRRFPADLTVLLTPPVGGRSVAQTSHLRCATALVAILNHTCLKKMRKITHYDFNLHDGLS
ncbi:hypothetical protein PoB_006947500 [Plakobranchus ocellatus]|uniref:Uncharacterized protein n=1 Tax=Plakobranchus ocellatus TaxID=259542 RepID=A0AAV4DFU0_9GAST|nr:hypothetical protein PoB_006947500 [Plakobranchus ocellatus]